MLDSLAATKDLPIQVEPDLGHITHSSSCVIVFTVVWFVVFAAVVFGGGGRGGLNYRAPPYFYL